MRDGERKRISDVFLSTREKLVIDAQVHSQSPFRLINRNLSKSVGINRYSSTRTSKTSIDEIWSGRSDFLSLVTKWQNKQQTYSITPRWRDVYRSSDESISSLNWKQIIAPTNSISRQALLWRGVFVIRRNRQWSIQIWWEMCVLRCHLEYSISRALISWPRKWMWHWILIWGWRHCLLFRSWVARDQLLYCSSSLMDNCQLTCRAAVGFENNNRVNLLFFTWKNSNEILSRTRCSASFSFQGTWPRLFLHYCGVLPSVEMFLTMATTWWSK